MIGVTTMETVYIVMWRDYEEDGIVSVHRTREGAERALQNEERYNPSLDHRVEEYAIED
jgi:hypothetical protein